MPKAKPLTLNAIRAEYKRIARARGAEHEERRQFLREKARELARLERLAARG